MDKDGYDESINAVPGDHNPWCLFSGVSEEEEPSVVSVVENVVKV